MEERDLEWVGRSLDDLKALPPEVQQSAGFALYQVQLGGMPQGAKSLKGVVGVMELRINHDTNTYRVVYVVNLGSVVYVLHSFQKKSTSGIATPKKELDMIMRRLKQARLLAEERATEHEPQNR